MKSAHSRRFAQLIAERRQQLIEYLIQNPFERTAGHISGFDEALLISEQADRELSGDTDGHR
jgi:hypothetical protein